MFFSPFRSNLFILFSIYNKILFIFPYCFYFTDQCTWNHRCLEYNTIEDKSQLFS
ncbi:hypothetical protein HMPREF7545_0269 [Selenomonas noxia ATCC 43541]|nr:hypothetical protein HMPREF7545_0269 [Selenomonas noxia ATCC 43541]